MAETNHITSATNSDREASSSGVPSDAPPARGAINRRQVMQLIGSTAAVPALAFAGAMPALAATGADRSEWEQALLVYRETNAEFDRLWAIHEAATEAAWKECPRVDRYFDEYKLGMGMSREAVARDVSYAVAHRVGYHGLIVYPSDAAQECEAKIQLMKEESERVADEFMDYQERSKAAHARHRIDELEDVAHGYGEEHYFPAREALMEIPAPDTAALLIKLEIAATSVCEDHMESCVADAKRLLATTH